MFMLSLPGKVSRNIGINIRFLHSLSEVGGIYMSTPGKSVYRPLLSLLNMQITDETVSASKKTHTWLRPVTYINF